MMRPTLCCTVACLLLVAVVEVDSEAVRHLEDYIRDQNETLRQLLPVPLKRVAAVAEAPKPPEASVPDEAPDGAESDDDEFYDAEDYWVEGEREAEVEAEAAAEEHYQDTAESLTDSRDGDYCADVDAVLDEADGRALKRAATGLWNRAKRVVNRVVEPPTKYLALVARFRSWQSEYKMFREDSLSWERPLPTAVQVMKAQFAKADHELMRALAERETSKGKTESELENMDVIYLILRLTAQRLEALNSRYKDAGSRAAAVETLMAAADDDKQSKERYDAARSRLLRTTKKTAAAMLQTELYILAKIMIYNELATVIASNPSIPGPDGGPAGLISSLILSLGQAHERVLISYLTGIKFRTAWYIFDQPSVKKTIGGCLLARKAALIIGKKYLSAGA